LKKFLLFIFYSFLAIGRTGGFFVWQRFKKNPEILVPYPYTFNYKAQVFNLDAPILLIGDRMGYYFSKFQTSLTHTVSVNLSTPIKVQSMARPGHALHRTLHELKSLSKWPQILIYQGASEEFSENKFMLTEMPKIKTNFSRYNNEKIQTLMMLFPWLSRIIYEPIERTHLSEVAATEGPHKYDEKAYLNKLETELMLFQQHLIDLVNLSRNKSSLLILMTTPLNLDAPPKKTCTFTSTSEIDEEILKLRNLLKENNPKQAYSHSSKLTKKYVGNAELMYFHGQISKRLGQLTESVRALQIASSYDCQAWRVTEIHNSIIRKIASEYQVILFDFAEMVQEDFTKNITFFNELYPENKYYERGMEQLGLVIKKILKL
jgi:hypothetical protein